MSKETDAVGADALVVAVQEPLRKIEGALHRMAAHVAMGLHSRMLLALRRSQDGAVEVRSELLILPGPLTRGLIEERLRESGWQEVSVQVEGDDVLVTRAKWSKP
jgi:hypothetical protein